MVRDKATRLVTLVVGAGLLMPTGVHADPPCDYRGTYSPCHYCFPTLWKLFRGPRVSRHAGEHYPDIQPDVEAGSYIYRTHCPYGEPRTYYDYPSLARSLERSSAPATAPMDGGGVGAEPIPAPKPVEDSGK